jgi:hypothetical protein
MTNEINKAICNVMFEIHRLEKMGVNAFDKYNFTSIDDFKDHVRPLMARHGLNASTNETSFDLVDLKNSKGDTKTNCKIGFAITLRHSDGSELPPDMATVMLPYTGAQTAGIARSYVLKEWLKGKFMASSGDVSEEADMRRQDDFTKTVLPKKEARPLFEALQKELRSIVAENNSATMLGWANDSREQVHQLPTEWQEEIRAEYVRELSTIKASEKMDGAKE